MSLFFAGGVMNEAQMGHTERRLTSPRAAGVAGILFAVLYGTAQVLIRLGVPESVTDRATVLSQQPNYIVIALSLVPFAGIAFLWFIGVVRDRIGRYEDQLFATVFLGSGLLFLAMMFVSAAIAGGLMAGLVMDPQLADDPYFGFGRSVMGLIINIYGLRMSGVFMMSFASIFLRTGVMPRWVAFLTLLLAVVLLLGVNLSVWLMLVFPAWVFVISLFILISNYRVSQQSIAGMTDAG
jgi:hypothetical protein